MYCKPSGNCSLVCKLDSGGEPGDVVNVVSFWLLLAGAGLHATSNNAAIAVIAKNKLEF